MLNKKYCFIVDLKDDVNLIAMYENYHRPGVIWPEIVEGIKQCGILEMDIYRVGDRLVMILETIPDFDLKRDFAKMTTLPRQKEWATIMHKFQKKIPFAKPDEHWVLMTRIFNLNNQIL
ncbi:L-rhamnose mutarotase [Pedobacter sp. Du54]|uniref:L-rhamnose mutarotase n=1 Tax=Pedobacter anseongensis TaxID=3133439 RepID=UPI0030985D2B